MKNRNLAATNICSRGYLVWISVFGHTNLAYTTLTDILAWQIFKLT